MTYLHVKFKNVRARSTTLFELVCAAGALLENHYKRERLGTLYLNSELCSRGRSLQSSEGFSPSTAGFLPH